METHSDAVNTIASLVFLARLAERGVAPKSTFGATAEIFAVRELPLITKTMQKVAK